MLTTLSPLTPSALPLAATSFASAPLATRATPISTTPAPHLSAYPKLEITPVARGTPRPVEPLEQSYRLGPLLAPPFARALNQTALAYLRSRPGGPTLRRTDPTTLLQRLYQQLQQDPLMPARYAGVAPTTTSRSELDTFTSFVMTEHSLFAGTPTRAVDSAFKAGVLPQVLLDILQTGNENTRLSLAGYPFADAINERLTLAQTRSRFVTHLVSKYPLLSSPATTWVAHTLLHHYRPALMREDAAQLSFGAVECANLEAGIALAQANGLDHRSADLRELSAWALTGGEILRSSDPSAGNIWHPQFAAALDHALANRQITRERHAAPYFETLVSATAGLDYQRSIMLARTLGPLQHPVERLLQPVMTLNGMAREQYAVQRAMGVPDAAKILRCLTPGATDEHQAETCRGLEARFNRQFFTRVGRIEGAANILLTGALEALPRVESQFLDAAIHAFYRVSLVYSAMASPDEAPPNQIVPMRSAVIVKASRGAEMRYYVARLISADSLFKRLPDTHDVPALLLSNPHLLIDEAIQAEMRDMTLVQVTTTLHPPGSTDTAGTGGMGNAGGSDAAGGAGGSHGLRQLSRSVAALMVEPAKELSGMPSNPLFRSATSSLSRQQWNALTLFQPCTPRPHRGSAGADSAYCTMASVQRNRVFDHSCQFRDGLFINVEAADDFNQFSAHMSRLAKHQAPQYLAGRYGMPMRAGHRLAALAEPATRTQIRAVLSGIPVRRQSRQTLALNSEPLPAAAIAPMLRTPLFDDTSLGTQVHRVMALGVEYLREAGSWRSVTDGASNAPPDSPLAAGHYAQRTVEEADHVAVECVAADCVDSAGPGSFYAYYSPHSKSPYGPLLQATTADIDAALYPRPPQPDQWLATVIETAGQRGDRVFRLPAGTRVVPLRQFGRQFINLAVFEIDGVLRCVRLTGDGTPLESLSKVLQRGEFRMAHCRPRRGRQNRLDCLEQSRVEIAGRPAVLLEDTHNPIFQQLPDEPLTPPLNEQTLLFIEHSDIDAAGEPVYTVWHDNADWEVRDIHGAVDLVYRRRAVTEPPETLEARLLAIDQGGSRRWAVSFHANAASNSRRAEVFRTFADSRGERQGMIYVDANTLYAFPMPAVLTDGAAITLRQPSDALADSYQTHRHRLLEAISGDSERHHVVIEAGATAVFLRILNAYLPDRLGQRVLDRLQSIDGDREARGETIARALTQEQLPAYSYHQCTSNIQHELCNVFNHRDNVDRLREELIGAFNLRHLGRSSIRALSPDSDEWDSVVQQFGQYFPDFHAPQRNATGTAASQQDALAACFRNAFGRRNAAYAEATYTDGSTERFFAVSGGGGRFIETANNTATQHNSLQRAEQEWDDAPARNDDLGTFLRNVAPNFGSADFPTVNANRVTRFRTVDAESLILRDLRSVLARRSANAPTMSALRLVTRLPICHHCLISSITLAMDFPDTAIEIIESDMAASKPASPVRTISGDQAIGAPVNALDRSSEAALEAQGLVSRVGLRPRHGMRRPAPGRDDSSRIGRMRVPSTPRPHKVDL